MISPDYHTCSLGADGMKDLVNALDPSSLD